MVARLPGWGLPRRGSGRVSRRGQRMGAWAFLVCRPVDGLERIDPSGALQDQRPNSIDPNDLHLAERAYCSHRYYRLVGVAYLSAPAGSAAKTAETLGITLAAPAPLVENRRVPGEWLEYSSLLTVIICSIGFTCLGKVILAKGPIAALDLNTYNFFPHAGPTPALDAPRLHPFGQGRGASHRWCTHSISFLCRHFWHDHQILDLARDGAVLCPDFYARYLSGADRRLLRCSWVVRAFGRKQVADRGALSPTGCDSTPR